QGGGALRHRPADQAADLVPVELVQVAAAGQPPSVLTHSDPRERPLTAPVGLHRQINDGGARSGLNDCHLPVEQVLQHQDLPHPPLEPAQVHDAGAERDRVGVDRQHPADRQKHPTPHRQLGDQPHHVRRPAVARARNDVADTPDSVSVGVEDGEPGDPRHVDPGGRHLASVEPGPAPVPWSFMSTLSYEIVDVFTDRPFAGNPLAVVFGADGLARDQMQAPAREAGCGISFTYLGVRPDAVARAVAGSYTGDICVYAWDPSANRSHARVFAGASGVAEDPATGSAALGFGVYLVATGLLPGDGESSYVVNQGIELHRPSTLECTVTAADGFAVRATVAGHVVPIARGEIAIPPFVG